ncbi:MAG: hypothetical protein SPF70_03685 [Lachnospiraceae bacterium]|nr:hypothetical protein [Lachnospiraceae bacterium]
MLNEKKVALMTKMAIYEQNEGKKSMPMSKYYRSDYMSLRMINSIIVSTLVYVIVLGLVILTNVEKILDDMVTMNYVTMGKNLFLIYVVVVAVNLVMTYIIYSHRFKQYRKGLNGYNGNLKKLYEICKQESRQKEQMRGVQDGETDRD